jgi:ABC-type transport system involved in multi-copper enzyme maturation permease subunit
MDELELLKKDWDKGEADFKNYSGSDIYTMLHKKSSSIVKTLFYISIAELVFWILVSYLPYLFSENMRERLLASYENPLFTILSIFGFLIIFLFIHLLYKAHKSITTTDSAKKLMESILKTRKVIKYYVLYNLISIFLLIPLSLYFEFNQNLEFHEEVAAFNSTQMLLLYTVVTVVTAVFLVLIWLFYKLLYGALLKRLNRNYDELKKLEV